MTVMLRLLLENILLRWREWRGRQAGELYIEPRWDTAMAATYRRYHQDSEHRTLT